MKTRAEHLQWCKDRALAYVEANDLTNAFASMGSDLGKHPETTEHPGMMLGMSLMMTGALNNAAAMRKFIEGFN